MAKSIQAFVSTGSEDTNQTHHFEQGSGDRGQPTRIQAVKGARYQLKDPAANEVGPDYIRSKRVDKNLHVSLYGSKEADLIIEGYYEEGFMALGSTGLYGMTESGQIYEYIPETPTTLGLAANLADGARPTSQVLGGAPIEGAFVLSALPFATVAATGINSAWLAAGAATAAVVSAEGGNGLKDVVPAGQTGQLDSSTDTGNVGDNLTRIKTPKISGKATPNAAVEVVIHGVTYSTNADDSGDYSITIPAANALPDGKYTPLIKVSNSAGTSVVDGTEFEVDSGTNGTGQMIHTASNDTGFSPTDGITNNNKPAFSGTGEAGADVKIPIGGKVLSALVDPNGNWVTAPYSDAIPDGIYPVKAIFTDKAGNTKEVDAGTVVIDTRVPQNQPNDSEDPNASASLSIGSIGSIDDGLLDNTNSTGSKDTGLSATDFVTQDNTLILQGQVTGFTDNGDKVHLQVLGANNTVAVDQYLTPSSGTWRYDNQANVLSDGTYTIKATLVDAAGNLLKEQTQPLTIDTTVNKNFDGINSITPNTDVNSNATVAITAIGTDTGAKPNDFVTHDNTLSYSGTVTNFTNNGDVVQLQLKDPAGSTLASTYVTPNTDGAWTWSDIQNNRSDGNYTLVATIVDKAGNRVNQLDQGQVTQVVTIDSSSTKNPSNGTADDSNAGNRLTLVISTINDPAQGSTDSGMSNADFVTNDPTLMIKGTAEGFNQLGAQAGDALRVQIIKADDSVARSEWVTVDSHYNWMLDNTSQPLDSGEYKIEAQVLDLAGNIVKVVSQRLTVSTVVNVAPVNQGFADQTANEDTVIAITGLSINDSANAGDNYTVRLTVTHGLLNVDGGNAAIRGNGTDTVTLVGTKSDVNATLAANVSFVPTANFNGSAQLTMATSDGSIGDAMSDEDSVTFTIVAVNDAPVVTPSTTDRSYTENDTSVVANDTLTLSDVDSDNITGATVKISSGLNADDVLAFTNTSNISGSYDANRGLLTLSGTATKADYQAALRAVTYSSSSENPTATSASRTLTWQIDDGQTANHASNSATSTINITAVNDAPVVKNDSATAKEAGGTNNGTVAAGASPSGNVLNNDSDPEDAALSIKTIFKGIPETNADIGMDVLADTTSTSSNATRTNGDYGTLTIGADGSYTYTVDNNKPAVQALNVNGTLTDVFTYTVQDASGASSSATITVTVKGANDAPVVANAIVDADAAEAEAFTYVIPTDAFTDVDNDTLTYTAVVVDENGVALTTQPSWFQFDPITRTVSGTPPSNSAGTVHVKVTVSDGSLSQSDVFDIGVAPAGQNHAPVPTQTSFTNVLTTGLTTTVSITDNQTSANTANNSTVTYTLKFSDAINTNTLAESDFSVMNGTLVANSLHQENATTWTVQAKTPSSGTNLMSLALNNNSYKSLNTKDGLGDTSIHAYGAESAVVDTTGSTAADTLLGSAADETFNIASGSTSATSGNDTVYAGGGDDKVFFNSFNVNGMDVDGGTGVNTLFVGGASESVTLDLTDSAVLARVQNFSSINITGRATPTTKNTLKLDWDAISRLSGTTDNPATYGVDESKLLVVSGDAGDEVQLTNFAAWSVGTLRNADTMRSELGNSYNFITGHTYKAYTLAGVTLFVDDNITTTSLTSSTSVYRPRSYAMTVQDLFGSSFTDSDAGHTFKGVAITSAGSSAEVTARGEYQYSTDQGTSWVSLAAGLTDASAKFLAPTVLVRFLGIAGTPTVNPTDLKGRLVDSSGETNSANLSTGDTVNVNTNGGSSAFSKNSITISTLNRAPVVNDADGQLPYDAMGTTLTSGITNPASIDNMFRSVYTDPDLHSFQGVFITAKGDTSLGRYEYSTNGIGADAVWKNFAALSDSKAVYLEKTDYLRFVPASGNTSVTKPQLTARLADRTAAFADFVAGTVYDVSGTHNGGSTSVSSDTITIVAPANTVGIAQASAGSTTVTTGQTLMTTAPTLSGSIGQLLKTGEVVEIWRDDTHVGDATISLGSSSWTYADSAVSAATHSYVAKYKASSAGAVLATSSSFSLVVAATPLVLDLNGDGVQTISFNESMLFDLLATGTKQSVGWVSKQDGLLALDLNGDGQINSGAELFGSSTVLPNGAHATDGWVALKTLDSNGDEKLDAQDAQFNQLRVWVDANGNGQTDAKELGTLADHHIASINLAANTHSVQQNGNVVQGFSTYTSTDGTTHEVADVGLQVHEVSSNTLLTLGNGASFDLSQVLHDSHLTQIDMSSDRESNTVTLTLNDLLSMPASNGVHQLTLTGDANDSVHIDLAEWVNTGYAVSEGGHTYAVYSDVAMHSAQLLIDQAVLTAHHVS
jgi:VCBS repeat-containing protein